MSAIHEETTPWSMSGFAPDGGLDPDPKVDRVFVYWNGEFGQEAQAAVEDASRQGIAVDVISVPYSNDELHKIAASLMEALAVRGMQPEGYRAGDPFDEIAVWGSALEQSAEARRVAEETATDILPPDLRFAIVESPGQAVPLDSRHNDGGQPTPGGGYLIGQYVCTSALGWVDPGFSPDRFYMQSAAHCVDYANLVAVAFEGNPYNAGTYSGYIGTLYGNPNELDSDDWLLDATLIGVPATPSIAGEMFTGSNTSSTKVDIPSIGAMVLNVTYCANGAATGTHCNVGRGSSGWSRIDLCYPYGCWVDAVPVTSLNQALIMGGGDSGGNIYRQSDRRVVATITAATQGQTYPCGSVNYWNPNAPCTNYGGWATEVTRVASELAETNPDLEPRLRP